MQRILDGVAAMEMLRMITAEGRATWPRATGVAMECPWLDGMVVNGR